MNSRKTAFAILGTLSLFFTSAPDASAQPVPEARQEILTITVIRPAYQGEFEALETPQAELLIDERALRDAGAVDLDQALDLSASVARQNNFGGLWNSFAVRGFVGDENLPSNYLVNGFNAGRGFGGPRDLGGIESVEVLKGPRAALFGRGEPGGTVNLVTRRPTFGNAGEVRMAAGSYGLRRVDGDWTAPLSDAAAARLVGFHEDAESFRDTVETTRYGFSPSLTVLLGDATRLDYELERAGQKIPFDRGVLAVNGRLGVIPESRFLGEPGDGPLEADVTGHQIELQHDFNETWSGLLGFNQRETSLEGFSTEPELSGSRQLLTTSRVTPLDDGKTLTRQRRFRDYDASYRVFRGEISADIDAGGTRHRLIIGADIDEFENDQVFRRARASGIGPASTLQGLQAIDIHDPVYGRYPPPVPGPLTDRVETQESFGFFVQDQISLTDRFDIRIGARYDDYSQTLNNRRSGGTSEQHETRTSPQFGAVYRAADDISLYAAYGENFRPLSGADADGDGFDPNQSTSIEAGVKFALRDGALTGTAAVFQVRQENILVVDDPSAFTLAAVGEAESRGFEIDLNGEIADGIDFRMSYSYVDAQTKNAFNDANFGAPVPAGSPLLNIPEHALGIQLARSVDIAGRGVRLGGGMLHVGERSGEFITDFKLPEYTVVRAFAVYSVADGITLRAEVDNLFDETHYTNSFSSLWVQPGAPRSFRVSAVFRF